MARTQTKTSKTVIFYLCMKDKMLCRGYTCRNAGFFLLRVFCSSPWQLLASPCCRSHGRRNELEGFTTATSLPVAYWWTATICTEQDWGEERDGYSLPFWLHFLLSLRETSRWVHARYRKSKEQCSLKIMGCITVNIRHMACSAEQFQYY